MVSQTVLSRVLPLMLLLLLLAVFVAAAAADAGADAEAAGASLLLVSWVGEPTGEADSPQRNERLHFS